MGLFFCYECKRENISQSPSNCTNSSSKFLYSSKNLLQNIKKAKTFSENEKKRMINLRHKKLKKIKIFSDVIQTQQEKLNK